MSEANKLSAFLLFVYAPNKVDLCLQNVLIFMPAFIAYGQLSGSQFSRMRAEDRSSNGSTW